MRTVIGVMGQGEHASDADCELGRRLGRLIAGEGWVLLSGGRRAGVMAAVNQGAHEAGGLTIGVVPGANRDDVSDAVDVAIVTGMGGARNNINVLSCDVVVVCGTPGAGTLSEIGLALKARRPVVLAGADAETEAYIGRLGGALVAVAATAADAIAEVRRLLAR